MSVRSRFARGIRNPRLFLRYANRLYHRRLNTRSYNTDGVDVIAEDWDNLLILDACRYDTFSEQSNLSGRLESRVSRGSATVEFLRGNVDGRDLRDTVYVTANPKLHENAHDFDVNFHAVVDVWKDGWDDSFDTVLPETTTRYARNAAREYPDKRLLVHYVQPHYPFIGANDDPFDNRQAFERPDEPGSWQDVFTGDLECSPAEVWDAYSATLDRVLGSVNDLLDDLQGLTVVSADHGNMVGERARPIPIREWGHPSGIYTEQLVRVPWLVVESETRRSITAEQSSGSVNDPDSDVVKDRLEHLGYT